MFDVLEMFRNRCPIMLATRSMEPFKEGFKASPTLDELVEKKFASLLAGTSKDALVLFRSKMSKMSSAVPFVTLLIFRTKTVSQVAKHARRSSDMTRQSKVVVVVVVVVVVHTGGYFAKHVGSHHWG